MELAPRPAAAVRGGRGSARGPAHPHEGPPLYGPVFEEARSRELSVWTNTDQHGQARTTGMDKGSGLVPVNSACRLELPWIGSWVDSRSGGRLPSPSR